MRPDEDHAASRAVWLEAHHARWVSSESLLRRIVTGAGEVPVRFERLIAGQANEVHAVVTASGAELVCRISRRPDCRFETEAAVINAVRRNGLPAPEVVAVGQLQEEGGQTGFILERRLAGRMLRDVILADPAATAGLLEQLGELLAAVHQVAVIGFGNLDPELKGSHATCSAWFVDVFVQRHLPAILAAVEGVADMAAVVREAADIVIAHRELLDAAPGRLAHGDVSPTNVLVADGRVTGLVDWEAVKGAPQANDFAWWTSGTVSLADPPGPEALVAGYQRATTLDDNFWIYFWLCQLRITLGLIGYAADVSDAQLQRRACASLRDLLVADHGLGH